MYILKIQKRQNFHMLKLSVFFPNCDNSHNQQSDKYCRSCPECQNGPTIHTFKLLELYISPKYHNCHNDHNFHNRQ